MDCSEWERSGARRRSEAGYLELIWSRGRWREKSRDQVELREERRLGLKEELRMRVETGLSSSVMLWSLCGSDTSTT